jgi:hypothetical protein
MAKAKMREDDRTTLGDTTIRVIGPALPRIEEITSVIRQDPITIEDPTLYARPEASHHAGSRNQSQSPVRGSREGRQTKLGKDQPALKSIAC